MIKIGKIYSSSKIAIYLFLGLLTGRPRYKSHTRVCPQKNIQHLKN
jgi:hypothetical protein